MREYSDAIKLPKSYPPTVVGRDYRLSYENTNCTLKKGKKKIRIIVMG